MFAKPEGLEHYSVLENILLIIEMLDLGWYIIRRRFEVQLLRSCMLSQALLLIVTRG
jgi:hypothetical protein